MLNQETLSFIKMNGLGNDFVIFDARKNTIELEKQKVIAISDRRTGVGCDQLIVIEKPVNKSADAFMRIYNADGGEVEACGNATRCVGFLLMNEIKKDNVTIETQIGLLHATKKSYDMITVDMGEIKSGWEDIPLSHAMETNNIEVNIGEFNKGTAFNIGNPHLCFLFENIQDASIEEYGSKIEHHSFFPQRTNVEAIEIISKNKVKVRVWERGVGMTQACGTGACAAAYAASSWTEMDKEIEVVLEGGSLLIDVSNKKHILMTGKVGVNYIGQIPK